MSEENTPLSVEQSLMAQHTEEGEMESMWTQEELEAQAAFVDEDDLFGLNAEPEPEEEEEGEPEESEEAEEGEEPAEESEEDEGGEPEEEESDEEEINWEELTTSLKEEKSNLNKALHAERTKKKELSDKVAELEASLQIAGANSYKEQFEAVMAQIEELELGEYIKVEKPQELDPRLQLLLQQQEQAAQAARQTQQVVEMQTVVTEELPKYTNINAESVEQGTILGQMIMNSVNNGAEMKDAVESSLNTLNTLLGKTTKTAKKTRTPVVKPKAKPAKAATHTKKAVDPQQRAINKGAQTGDFGDFFKQMGAKMAGDN